MGLPGFADLEGTEKFFHLHSIHPDKKRAFDGVFVSSLGIGTLLGDGDQKTDQLYQKAIISSIEGGINLIDTACHFRGQKSEKIIGKVLSELKPLSIHRNEFVLLSKAGYIPFEEGEESYERYIQKYYLDKKIIRVEDIVDQCHCLSPTFLEYQIEKSRENMQIDTIDLFCLQNPELQLKEKSYEVFQESLLVAFELLEKKVSENKIRRYGITSWNGFRKKKEAKDCLNLYELCRMAEKVGGKEHHLRAIQLPINLIMLEAFKMKNQGNEESSFKNVLEACQELNLFIFSLAPFMQGQIFQLPSRIFESLPVESSHALKALQLIGSSYQGASILLGMKDPIHIHENLRFLQRANWSLEEWKLAVEPFLES